MMKSLITGVTKAVGPLRSAVNTLDENAHRNQQTTDLKLDSTLPTLKGTTLSSPAAPEPIAPLIPYDSEGFDASPDVVDVDADSSSSSSAATPPDATAAKQPALKALDETAVATETTDDKAKDKVTRAESISPTGIADGNGDMVMLAPSVVTTPLIHKVRDTGWIIIGTGSGAQGHQAKVQSLVETPSMEGYVVSTDKLAVGPAFLHPDGVAKDEEGMRALLVDAKTHHAKRVSPHLASQHSGPY